MAERARYFANTLERVWKVRPALKCVRRYSSRQRSRSYPARGVVSKLSPITKISPLRLVTGLAGAFVAAVCASVVLSCGYALLLATGNETGSADVRGGLLFVAVNAAYVSAQLALLAIAVLALPHVIVSQQLRRTSKRYFVLSGMVIGLITIAVAGIWQRRLPGPPFHIGADQYFFVVSAIAAGAVSALVYRKIAYPAH
jgi:hypothetical protein